MAALTAHQQAPPDLIVSSVVEPPLSLPSVFSSVLLRTVVPGGLPGKWGTNPSRKTGDGSEISPRQDQAAATSLLLISAACCVPGAHVLLAVDAADDSTANHPSAARGGTSSSSDSLLSDDVSVIFPSQVVLTEFVVDEQSTGEELADFVFHGTPQANATTSSSQNQRPSMHRRVPSSGQAGSAPGHRRVQSNSGGVFTSGLQGGRAPAAGRGHRRGVSIGAESDGAGDVPTPPSEVQSVSSMPAAASGLGAPALSGGGDSGNDVLGGAPRGGLTSTPRIVLGSAGSGRLLPSQPAGHLLDDEHRVLLLRNVDRASPNFRAVLRECLLTGRMPVTASSLVNDPASPSRRSRRLGGGVGEGGPGIATRASDGAPASGGPATTSPPSRRCAPMTIVSTVRIANLCAVDEQLRVAFALCAVYLRPLGSLPPTPRPRRPVERGGGGGRSAAAAVHRGLQPSSMDWRQLVQPMSGATAVERPLPREDPLSGGAQGAGTMLSDVSGRLMRPASSNVPGDAFAASIVARLLRQQTPCELSAPPSATVSASHSPPGNRLAGGGGPASLYWRDESPARFPPGMIALPSVTQLRRVHKLVHMATSVERFLRVQLLLLRSWLTCPSLAASIGSAAVWHFDTWCDILAASVALMGASTLSDILARRHHFQQHVQEAESGDRHAHRVMPRRLVISADDVMALLPYFVSHSLLAGDWLLAKRPSVDSNLEGDTVLLERGSEAVAQRVVSQMRLSRQEANAVARYFGPSATNGANRNPTVNPADASAPPPRASRLIERAVAVARCMENSVLRGDGVRGDSGWGSMLQATARRAVGGDGPPAGSIGFEFDPLSATLGGGGGLSILSPGSRPSGEGQMLGDARGAHGGPPSPQRFLRQRLTSDPSGAYSPRDHRRSLRRAGSVALDSRGSYPNVDLCFTAGSIWDASFVVIGTARSSTTPFNSARPAQAPSADGDPFDFVVAADPSPSPPRGAGVGPAMAMERAVSSNIAATAASIGGGVFDRLASNWDVEPVASIGMASGHGASNSKQLQQQVNGNFEPSAGQLVASLREHQMSLDEVIEVVYAWVAAGCVVVPPPS